MNQGSYHDPVRYTPPVYQKPKANYTPWLVGCGSCLVLIVVLIGLMAWSIQRAVDEMRPEVREAGMLSGSQLAWRELDYHPTNIFVPVTYMRSVDADGDGLRELVFWDSSGDADVDIVSLDGKMVRRHHWMPEIDNESVEFWDFDGDGCDDVVYDDEDGSTPRTYVADFDMNSLHTFEGMLLPDWRATADCDGDGDMELLLHEQDYSHCKLYNQGGTELLSIANSDGDSDGVFQQDCLLVDMDGDGRYSVLFGDGPVKMIVHVDGKRSSLTLPDDPLMTMGPMFEMVADIDGDGVTELLPSWGDYFYEHTEGRVRELQNPGEGSMFSDMWLYRIPLAVFDHDGDGRKSMWTVPEAEMGTELVAYGPLGSVEYHEALEKYCTGLEVVADADGVEHLVVCAFDKVLVYP
ncbi:MAG: hypothetical protein H7A35_03885 [Planctomycetales bacterium]|nr:hypothetical protein [bacterium]UNM09197.1 MAG: hypothetical protein H7A35_03885 [Planctomycetales bacterium]